MFKPDFKPGDIIDFCGDQFEVLENNGYSGKVREYPNTQENNWGFQTVIYPFYWEFDGEKSKLIKRKD